MAFQNSTDNIDIPNRSNVAWAATPGGYNGTTNAADFVAGGTIGPNRIVIPGSIAGQVTQAAAATGALLGVSVAPQAALVNQPVLIACAGIVQVEAGAAITAGAMLTSDAQGRAVASATGNRVIGVALDAGAAAGVLVRVALSQGVSG